MFADVVLSTEGLVMIGTLGTILLGAISVIFKLLMAQYAAQLEDMKSQRESYKEIADDSTRALERLANEVRGKKGKPPATVMAPIVPEHHSPVTPAQQATADLQTMRARLTAATLDLDLPAREAGPPQFPLDPNTPLSSEVKAVLDQQVAAAEKQMVAAAIQEAAAAKQEATIEKLSEIIANTPPSPTEPTPQPKPPAN